MENKALWTHSEAERPWLFEADNGRTTTNREERKHDGITEVTQNQWKPGRVDPPSLWAAGSSRVFSDCPDGFLFALDKEGLWGARGPALHQHVSLGPSGWLQVCPSVQQCRWSPQPCAQRRPQSPHQHGRWATPGSQTELTSRKIEALPSAVPWDGRSRPSPRVALHHGAWDPGPSTEQTLQMQARQPAKPGSRRTSAGRDFPTREGPGFSQ